LVVVGVTQLHIQSVAFVKQLHQVVRIAGVAPGRKAEQTPIFELNSLTANFETGCR
jgi:hypothetical protein